MKNIYLIHIGLCFFLLMFLTNCNEKKDRSQKIKNDFEQRKALAANRHNELFAVFEQEDMTIEEREALEFLYAYMPYSDLADYDGDFFLKQVKQAFEAKRFFSWGESIPDEIFRHFVLVHRVNNEDLDTCRVYFFNELKDRIKDMSVYDAAKEVNHWCHERVTYRPSDSRTSSPLATLKTALGRCGEESTFVVAALRAVGLPARQCYTPRWAHTDSNHAWVEVWINGTWYYMGACEPEPELNMGWFSTPSTRAMLIQSVCYGDYYGEEEVFYSSNLFSKINMLSNYTRTKRISVIALDSSGRPVKNAEVKFKLYNYSEYYPIATSITDEKGTAELTTGFGDLLIWASKDDAYGYEKMNVRNTNELYVRLTLRQGGEYVDTLDISPPTEIVQKVTIDPKKINKNNKRLQYENSLRAAYLATFPNEEDITESNENLTHEQLWEIVRLSEGNYQEIRKFLAQNDKRQEGVYIYEFLRSLSDKDIRDTPAEVLQQHITVYDKNKYPFDVYLKGIISARIANELIRPWRHFLATELQKQLGGNISAQAIAEWIKNNLHIDDEGNYFKCPISPRGVYELRYTDAISRDIFFVAACRSLDIPAYRDKTNGQLWVYENGQWNLVSLDETRKINNTGKLIINYTSTDEIKPGYRTHFTIAKYKNGDFITLDYGDDQRINTFPATLDMEPGYYMLSTGNRYSDGSTLSYLDFFNIGDGETVEKELILRALKPRKENYGKIDLQRTIEIDEKPLKIVELAKTKPLIICFIDPGKEPTVHLLNNMGAWKEQFDMWDGNLLFIISSDKKTTDFNLKEWDLPARSQLMYDEDNSWMNNILSSTNQYFRDNYPLVFIVDTEGNLIFKTEGYRIGTGELIYKSLPM